ncbi:CDP-glucose 4,6-dehydratase [Spirosoma sp. SC4-14]|uniref:CDP-glucose 4,6-dehydratase n=1 Tax=Spirosoma sp. SC4-14 TaxID=3128900 RepID=UPI0030CBA270
MTHLFGKVYTGKSVLITGHTGFKGSWLTYWLQKMGAIVTGYSLPAPTEPNHWSLLSLPIAHHLGDIREQVAMQAVFDQHQPEIVFHLAAQPLVRYSYQHPIETLDTNILGTAKVLECVRHTPSVRAVVIISSDKCYENPEDGHPLTETERMGGYDPYSVSKGCTELITSSYRRSYFNHKHYGQKHQVLIASGRAGNVIGGGDWATDRLIPDLVKSTVSGHQVIIRNPLAVRPWQHVLEPLSGYLLVGQRLLEGHTNVADGWNFGPNSNDVLPVREVIRLARQIWPAIDCNEFSFESNPHEAHLLSLDCTKAHAQLAWRPVWDTPTAIARTIGWYRRWYQQRQILSHQDLEHYIETARQANLIWTQ